MIIKLWPVITEEPRILTVDFVPGQPISEYLKDVDLSGQKIIASGRVVEGDYLPQIWDEIIVTPQVNDPVSAIVAVFTAIATYAAAHPVLFALYLLSTAFSIYSFLNKPRLPSFGSSGEGLDQGSPTYSWEGGRTIQEVGTPVPIIYGRHKAFGNIINQYQSTDGEKNYLNLLLLICEGEVESISNIKLNDNPIENFDAVTSEIRLGTNVQDIIPSFTDIHDLRVQSFTLLKDNPVTYTTAGSLLEAFELYLTFQAGLYAQLSSGQIVSSEATFQIRYKIHGAGSWEDTLTVTYNEKIRGSFKRIYRVEGLTPGQYDIEVTKLTDDTHSSDGTFYYADVLLSDVDEITTEDIAYVNRALVGIRALATNQISGAIPNISCLVEGTKISVPDIRNSGVPVDWEDYYWDPDTEEYKLLSDNTVLTWDGTTYVSAFSANPIWCIRDLLLNSRYGLGDLMSADDIDLASFLEMSQYCEELADNGLGGFEKRFRLDVIIDSRTNAMDLLVQLCSSFRGLPFYSQGKVNLQLDRPKSATQLFGMGNILKDSFSQRWKSKKEVYNMIEVQFLNQDKDYEQDTLMVIDEESIASGEEQKIRQLRLFLTRPSQALREGRYALKIGKLIDQTITLKSQFNAVVSQVCDVINVSHDVPGIGFSGRVETGSTTTSVKLDRNVVIETGKSYRLQVFFKDDTWEERTVTNSPSTTNTITVSSAFSQAPENFNVYAFGEVSILVKPYRLISIQRNNREQVSLAAVEYDEQVYVDDPVILPETKYSTLNLEFPEVQNLSLTELIVKLKDGTIDNVIDVWFSRPNQTANAVFVYDFCRVYVSDNGGDSWTLYGQTAGESFRVQGGIKDLETYRIAVVCVTKNAEEGTLSQSPYEDITVIGKSAPPEDVTGFEVQQSNDQLRFKWNPNPDVDLARYVIKRGADWATGEIIAEKVDITDFKDPVSIIGLQKYMIKAVDTSGNESSTPSTDEITVVPPPDGNFVNTADQWTQNRRYKLTNVDVIQTNLFDAAYTRDTFVLKTTTTWQSLTGDWDGLDLSNQTVEASGTIEQVEPFDLGYVSDFNIILDPRFFTALGGTVGVEVSYSQDGITYEPFAAVDAGTVYKGRYFLFRYTLAASNTAYQIYFYAAQILFSSGSVKRDVFRDILVDIAGTHIDFTQNFSSPPVFQGGGIVNGILGRIILDNKDENGVDVYVYDKDDNPLGTAEVDLTFTGV